jgi:hypothetical protein
VKRKISFHVACLLTLDVRQKPFVAFFQRFHGHMLIQLVIWRLIEEVDPRRRAIRVRAINEVEAIGFWEQFAECGYANVSSSSCIKLRLLLKRRTSKCYIIKRN